MLGNHWIRLFPIFHYYQQHCNNYSLQVLMCPQLRAPLESPPGAELCSCMQKPIQHCKAIFLQLKNKFKKKNNNNKRKKKEEYPLGRETARSKAMNIFQFPRCFQTGLQNISPNKTMSSSFLDPQRFSQILAHRRHSENFYQMTRIGQKFKR